jgi:hypothetical protein
MGLRVLLSLILSALRAVAVILRMRVPAQLMVVDDFNVVRVSRAKFKTQPELVVDADAVLALAITSQCLQLISWRRGQIAELARIFQLKELTLGDLSQVRRRDLPAFSGKIKLLGLAVREALDHRYINATRY